MTYFLGAATSSGALSETYSRREVLSVDSNSSQAEEKWLLVLIWTVAYLVTWVSYHMKLTVPLLSNIQKIGIAMDGSIKDVG